MTITDQLTQNHKAAVFALFDDAWHIRTFRKWINGIAAGHYPSAYYMPCLQEIVEHEPMDYAETVLISRALACEYLEHKGVSID